MLAEGSVVSIPPSELYLEEQHTMLDALVPFCEKWALLRKHEDAPCLILGGNDDLLKEYARDQGWNMHKRQPSEEVASRKVRGFLKEYDRVYNVSRCKLFKFVTKEQDTQRVLLVYGGRALVRLYGMAESFLRKKKKSVCLEVKMFKDVPQKLINSSGLQQIHLQGAVVVLGNVVWLAEYVQSNKPQWCANHAGDLFCLPQDKEWGYYEFSSSSSFRVVFLGYRGSYLGDVASCVAEAIYSFGAVEILHLAKAGSLTSPKELGERLVCPKQFVLVDENGATEEIRLRNAFRECELFVLEGGTHASVPTVLDERLLFMKKVLKSDSVGTVDNEGSFMAEVASRKEKPFGALYFESDYLHRHHEKHVLGASLLDKVRVPYELLGKQLVEYLNWRHSRIVESDFKTQLKAELSVKYSNFSLSDVEGLSHGNVMLSDLNRFLQLQIRKGLERGAAEPSAPLVQLSELWKLGASRVILYGKAGSGKSSICKYICFQSVCKLDALWQDRFDVVLLLDLSRLKGYESFGMEEVAKELVAGTSLESKWMQLLAWMRGSSSRFLLMLDGVDEIWESKSFVAVQRFVQMVLEHQVSEVKNVLVTSRPLFSVRVSPVEKWSVCDVLGFDMTRLKLFVERYFNGQDGYLQNAEMILSKHPQIVQLCLLPWHAKIFCYVMRNGKLEVSNFSVVRLYQGMMDALATPFRLRVERLEGEFLEWREVMGSLERLAATSLARHTPFVPVDVWIALDRKTQRSLVQSGLLKCASGADEQYFAHFTLMEFLAAKFLSQTEDHFSSQVYGLKLSRENAMFVRFLGGLLKDSAKKATLFSIAQRIAERSLGEVLLDKSLIFFVSAPAFYGVDVVVELAAAWEFGLSKWVKSVVDPRLFPMVAECAVQHFAVMKDLCSLIEPKVMLQAACDQGQVKEISYLLDQVGTAKGINIASLGEKNLVTSALKVARAGADLASAVSGAAAGGTEKTLQRLFDALPRESRAGVQLGAAVQRGCRDSVKTLLRGGCSLSQHVPWKGFLVNLVSYYALTDDADMVKFLLEHGGDVHDAISGAAAASDTTLLVNLIDRGPKRDMAKVDLNLAASVGAQEVLIYLMDKGAVIGSVYGWTPIMMATMSGNFKVTKFLLERDKKLIDRASETMWSPPQQSLVVKFQFDQTGIVSLINAASCAGWTALHIAAVLGFEKIAMLLCQHGADARVKNGHGWNPLGSAAHHGYVSIVRLLCDHFPALIHELNQDGWSALKAACEFGHEKVVELLLSRGADVEVRESRTGASAAYVAAQNGHVKCLKLLKEANAKLEARRSDGRTPIEAACQNGRVETARFLLEAKCKIGVSLHVASQLGHLSVVQLLLEYGADVDARHVGFSTPLALAVRAGHAAVVSRLIEEGASTVLSPHPIIAACEFGHLQVVQVLVERAGCKNIKSPNGLTPVLIACQAERWDVVEYLIKCGAEVDIDQDGWSVLMHVVRAGDPYLLETLLQGRDVDVVSYGDAALRIAYQYNKRDVAEILIKHGAASAKTVHAAAQAEDLGFLEMLLECNCDVDVRDAQGRTPLWEACSKGLMKAAKMLLERKADPNAIDKSGLSPLCAACVMGHEDVFDLLFEWEVDIDNLEGTKSPLICCVGGNKVRLAQKLLAKGANTGATDSMGKNALDYALQKDLPKMVACLGGQDDIT